MEFAQIRAMVEKKSDFPTDGSGIRITVGSTPDNAAGERLFRRFQAEIEKSGPAARVSKAGSFGCRDLEPIVAVNAPDRPGILYLKADPESPLDLEADETVPVATLPGGGAYLVREEAGGAPHFSTHPFFNLQNRIALRNCGWIDPGNIDQYILSGYGFTALSRALTNNPQTVLRMFESSAPQSYIHTGCSSLDRWKECMEIGSRDKYLVCNAVAEDPRGQGARLLLESGPFTVLEGMLIGAYALGASLCILCIRAGSGALHNLRKAIGKMGEYSLLGVGILESSFNTKIEIREVPEDYRPGNELLSLNCIDRKQSDPHLFPAYPEIGALTQNPAIVVNPETLAYLPAIFLERNELLAGFGADIGKASRVLSLSGSVVNMGTVEVPCGVSIRRMIEEIGGGIAGGAGLKAVQAGIPTGVLLGSEALDACSHCGTTETVDAGSIEVLDTDTDIVETARKQMEAIHDQSCGKCLLCCEGSRQMYRVLENIAGGRGKSEDLDLLKELCNTIRTGCLCAFGPAATDFVRSGLDLFRRDYLERMRETGGVDQT